MQWKSSTCTNGLITFGHNSKHRFLIRSSNQGSTNSARGAIAKSISSVYEQTYKRKAQIGAIWPWRCITGSLQWNMYLFDYSMDPSSKLKLTDRILRIVGNISMWSRLGGVVRRPWTQSFFLSHIVFNASMICFSINLPEYFSLAWSRMCERPYSMPPVCVCM